MKTTTRTIILTASLLLAPLAALPAANLYWDGGTVDITGNGNGASGGTAGTWDTTIKNWDAGAVPYVAWNNTTNANDTAYFAGTAGTVTLGSAITANGLVFGTASYILSGANTLTLNGTTPTITANANATIGSNTAIILDGTTGLIKNGTGTLTVNSSATHNLSGGVTVNAGTLALSLANLTVPTDPLINGTALVLGGGVLTLTGKASTTSTQTLGAVTINSGGSSITVTGGSSSTMNLTLGNTWTRNPGGMLNMTLGTGGSITTGLTPTASIIGTWASFGTTTSTKYAIVSGGYIAGLTGTPAADGAALGTDATANYDLATFGGTVAAEVSANTIRYQGAAGATAPGATSFTVNGLMNAGSGVWTINTNPITIGSDMELVVNPAAQNIVISTAINDNIAGPSALTINSAGNTKAVVLGGANTFTGPVTVNGNGGLGDGQYGLDVTAAGGLNASGVAGAFGKSGSASSNIVLNKAVVLTRATSTSDHGLTITGNCGFFVKGAFTQTISGTITGTGNLSVDGDYSGGEGGTGNLKLTGSNDFTGDVVVVNDGHLTLGHVSAISMATLNYDAAMARCLADLTSNNLAYIIGGLKGNKNLNLGSGSGGGGSGVVSIGNNNLSNSYIGSLAGTAGFTKIGSGTQTLFGKQNYTGPTTVSTGTLKLGSVAATGPVNATGANAAFTLTAIAGGTAGLATGQAVTGANVGAGAVIASIDSGSQVTLTVAHTAAFTLAPVTFGATAGSLPATTTTVADTATLSGAGTINGALSVNAGGTIQPTTSGTPGTLTLTSATSPVFAANGTLKVRVPTTTTADKVSLTHAAASFACDNIDLVIDATGLPANASGVTIVQTANAAGISGTFHSVTSNNGYAALVHYNAQSVTVDLYVPVPHLAITSVNGGSNPIVNTGFDVTVQAQDDFNNPFNVAASTNITLSLGSGTGNLGGSLGGTINAGTNSFTFTGVTYDKAESGVVLVATRTSGDNLEAGNSIPVTVINTPTTLAMTSGNNQSASFGTALINPFVVTVTDAGGAPVPGIGVTFAIDSTPAGATGQSLSTTTVNTDLSGHASTILTLGNTIGTYTVTATSVTLAGSPLIFTAAATIYAGNINWDGGSSDILTNGNNTSEGGAGTWDTAIRNWDTGLNAHVAWDNVNYSLATATFAGTADVVTLGANDIVVSKLAFTGAYTLAGNGHNLTLNGTGTTISGGTLSGFNTITLANDQTWATTAADGSIETAGHTLTLGGFSVTPLITGTGGLTLTDAATLNAANNYTGVTTLSGSMAFPSGINPFANAGLPSRFGAATADPANMVLSSGELTLNAVSPTTDHGFTLIGNSGFYEKNGTLTINGTITGTGGLSMKGDYTGGIGGNGRLILAGANTHTGDTSLFYDCRITLANVNALSLSTLNASVGARASWDLTTNNLAYVIGGLKGSGNLNLGTGMGGGGSGSVSFGNNNQSNDYSGALSGTAGFTKIGSGIQSLGGINIHTGNTTVNGGTLALADNAGLKFALTDTTSNKITGNGTGILTLDGDFHIDTSAMTAISGSWTLIELANVATTFTGNFSVKDSTADPVKDFIADPDGVTWKLVDGARTWTFSEATGVLTLATSGFAYETWAIAKGLTSANNGLDMDPDLDGVTNLAEFAFNGNPLSGADNGRIYVLAADTDGDTAKELVLTIAVRTGTPVFSGSPSPTAAVDGITYLVEGSTNLSGFTAPVSVVPTPVTTGLPAAGTDYEYRSFSLDGSNGMPGKGFLRAKVTQP